MGKKKTLKTIDLPQEEDTTTDVLEEIQKPYEITSASIKEQKCNYGYEIKTGLTAGDKIPTRKGEAVIHEDMQKAFDALRIHFAVAAGGFKHQYDELPDFDVLKDSSIIEEYHVTGYKVSGVEEDEGYTISGYTYVPLGTIDFDTPKITKGNYKYFDKLKEKMDVARNEVELYMNGKHDEDEDDNQQELPFPEGKTSADEFDEEE